MRKKEKKYFTDAETGVRRLPVIENLPVKALTDQEICKLFFERFGADALVMVYLTENDPPQLFGRVRTTSKILPMYRRLLTNFDVAYGYAIDNREIPEAEI